MRLAVLAAVIAALPGPVLAWGATGHRIVGVVAAQALPDEVPAFLRTPQAVAEIGELSREPDRSKGAGKLHDSDRDGAHYIDVDDAGLVMGGPPLAALPATRAQYDTALRAAGSDSWEAGWLYYSLVGSWQQLTKDFAYWRALTAAEEQANDPQRRDWYAADRARREALILRDLGELSHYVADGSQPMHVSVHFNGWGAYPNPRGYTTARVHASFEGAFVRANVTQEMVAAAMAPPADCACSPERRTTAYLQATWRAVEPFYALEKAGAFSGQDPRGRDFAVQRLAAGASELRDLVAAAWRASASASIGWPPTRVPDIEAGVTDPYDRLLGAD
jgi:hypothetical protein